MRNKSISRTEGLGLRLRHVHSLWRSVVDQTVQPLGLTQSRWTVLITLRYLGDGSTQKILAETLEIELPSLSRTLDQLAQQGLVERRTCATDRRAREVFFTPRGREVLAALETRASEAREQMVAGISDGDFDAFERVLAAIEENAARELGGT